MRRTRRDSPRILHRPLCFLIGPIGSQNSPQRKHADMVLNLLVKEVLESREFGYQVRRADEVADPGMIGDQILANIINADLVIADLTDLNPNVFYELGIRHYVTKPTIHIAKLGTPLPFDNAAHRTIFVDIGHWESIEFARITLSDSVRAIRQPDFRTNNPVTQA